MNRHTTEDRNTKTLTFHGWLRLRRNGDMELLRGMPSLAADERGMHINVTVPIAVFQTPSLSAKITVAEPKGEPIHIDTQVAADALRAALGCDVVVSVTHPTEK